MTTVTAIGSTATFGATAQAPGDALSVAAALSTLKLRPGSTVAIADTLANIQKNLEALQGQAARITGLVTTDATQQLVVTAAQFQKNAGILARWGAGSGNTVEVTGVGAAGAKAFVAARPAYVSSITVSDSSANLQRNLDDLQALVSSGSLRQIVHTGPATPLKITAAQLTANADALNAIKNQAYTLAITEASVSDSLGLGGATALAANKRIKSIEVKDGTDAIEANLDALQRMGLKLRSIAQTDADNTLTVSASQFSKDAVALGKIITPYQLDVIRASAAQAAQLAANQKVVTVAVADTAANISRKWALMQRLSDSLASVEVTDPTHALTLTGDQLALGTELLARFTDDAEHSYRLEVSGVKAGQAAAVAALDNVAAVNVSDSADNIVANLDALQAVNELGLLKGITLTGKKPLLTLDMARLQGAALTATQGVLDTIGGGHYALAVTGVSTAALDDIAANAHVVAIEVAASSDEIEASLDTLYQLGKRVTRIQQSDSGGAIDVTQAVYESRASVLAKIDSGYSVNLTGVAAAKALSYAMNSRVASVSVADTGRNLVASWGALRAIGSTLATVSKTDDGPLLLSAAQYLAAQADALTDRFDAAQQFSVTGATVAQALELAADNAVDRIDLMDDGRAVADGIGALADLASGGKLVGIVLNTGATSVALHGDQLDAAQPVLDLVKGGRYTLALDQVDVADVQGLLAANSRITRLKVSGDAAGIVGSLADLAAAGSRLTSVEQTDAAGTALALTGAAFEQYRGTLARIVGGFQAELSEVSAARAATLAASTAVKSLQVTDTAAHLATAWNALGTLGAKLSDITQSDSDLVQLTAQQWASAHAVADRFATPLGVAISGASVADLATLAADDAVQQVRLIDSAATLADAWTELAADTKLTQIRITDAGTPMAMTAATHAASTELLAKISDGQYQLALSDVAVADAVTLGADSHVATLDVSGDSADIGTAFADLSALAKLGSITLTDDNGTLALSAAQLLGGTATLARITNAYQVAASGVSLAQLADVLAVDEVASVAVSDLAANVSDNFNDLVALGGMLSGLHLDDDTPVLTLSQADWSAGTTLLSGIGGAYQVDLGDVEAGAVATLAADATLRQLSVTDTAANIASHWDALVAAFDSGSGKLVALVPGDDEPLTLTEAQQTAGAALISALLADVPIVTAP